MATKSLSDAKQNRLQAQLSSTVQNVNTLEWNYYSANSGLTPVTKFSIADHKKAFYALKGIAVGSLPFMERAYFKAQGAVGNSLNEVALDFYLNHVFV